MRAPSAERFIRDLELQVKEAQANLNSQCAFSSDPKVTAYFQTWKTLSDLTTFLASVRREGPKEEDE